MNLQNTKLHFLQKENGLGKVSKTGISLHCHTQFSKESLDFIPFYAEKFPVINYFWKKEHAKYIKREGKNINFETAYWQPPLSEEDVYSLEKEQIESLGLNPIVSITDHDEIEANLRICKHTPNELAPISMEWTVPFENGFFHLGIHNLPKEKASEITQILLDYTFSKELPDNKRLHEIFAMLNEYPEILVILNHPMWDIEMAGEEQHKILLRRFINQHLKWIHAFEVNGFRSWSENKAVIELAGWLGIPLCSGGDRHGCQANTILNLTDAQSFAEFAEEVRKDKYTELILMPEYNVPLPSRQLQSFAEILNHYQHFPVGRRQWFERVFFDKDGEGLHPLTEYGWKYGGPKWLQASINVLKFLGSPKFRPFYQMLRKREDVVSQLTNGKKVKVNQESLLTKRGRSIAHS